MHCAASPFSSCRPLLGSSYGASCKVREAITLGTQICVIVTMRSTDRLRTGRGGGRTLWVRITLSPLAGKLSSLPPGPLLAIVVEFSPIRPHLRLVIHAPPAGVGPKLSSLASMSVDPDCEPSSLTEMALPSVNRTLARPSVAPPTPTSIGRMSSWLPLATPIVPSGPGSTVAITSPAPRTRQRYQRLTPVYSVSSSSCPFSIVKPDGRDGRS